MTSFKTVVELGCHYKNTVLELPECSKAKVWLVEAVDELFKLIPERKNVYKICAAVTPDYTGKKNMSGISIDTQVKYNLPEWSTTMASLNKDHPTIKKFEWENHKSNIEVDCLSVKDLWDTYKLPYKIDFLCMDLEGYDFNVLLSIFKNNIEAKFICFESKLMTEEEISIIKKTLKKNGYKHFQEGSEKDFAGVPFNSYAWKNKCPLSELK
jgi:hypothetical protein